MSSADFERSAQGGDGEGAPSAEVDEGVPQRVQDAQAVVAADPYDSVAWNAIMTYARTLPAEAARPLFQDFLEVFPTSAEHWQAFAEREFTSGNHAETEAILAHALPRVPSPALWEFYIQYIRNTTLVPALAAAQEEGAKGGEEGAHPATDAVVAARDAVSAAYESALGRLGSAWGAEGLWEGFIAHLKLAPATGVHAVTMKRAAVRSAYQRAVVCPLPGVGGLRSEYAHWESSQGEAGASAEALAALEVPHNNAVKAATTRKGLWQGIVPSTLARPPPEARLGTTTITPDAAAAGQHLRGQLRAWTGVVRFELTNPLHLPTPEFLALARVTLEQALLCVGPFPDLWQEYAMLESAHGTADAAAAVYARAVEAVPQCATLAFVAADFLEFSGKGDAAVGVLEALVERAPSCLAFIQLQRSMRRVKGPRAARAVFARARTAPCAGPELFLAAAALERDANGDDDSAARILKAGHRRYPTHPGYAVAYLSFMVGASDDGNVRSLFENILSVLPREAARPVWDRYVHFELRRCKGGGSVTTLARVERRRGEMYPEDAGSFTSALGALSHRYQHFGLSPSAPGDVEFGVRHPAKPHLTHTLEGVEVPSDSRLASYLSHAPPAPGAGGAGGRQGGPGGIVDTAGGGAVRGPAATSTALPMGSPAWLAPLVAALPPATPVQAPGDAEVEFIMRTLLTAGTPAQPPVAYHVLSPNAPPMRHAAPHRAAAPVQPSHRGGGMPPPMAQGPPPTYGSHRGPPPPQRGAGGMLPLPRAAPPQTGMPPGMPPGGLVIQDTAGGGRGPPMGMQQYGGHKRPAPSHGAPPPAKAPRGGSYGRY